ncbi:ribonuclease H-like domain-containing protein [Tanacetum coccineum]
MTGSVAPLVILLSDKLMIITSLRTLVPVQLDIDEMNYSSWIYFFQNLCRGHELLKHILGEPTDEATSSDLTPPTTKWLKIDSIVLSWIFYDLIQNPSSTSPISNDDVVTIALEGLPDKYENISGIITHREPFPDLKTTRSMLTTKEIQYTWHQHLGHPESQVLCRVLSSNSISCNKEKPPILFHACQLGKHVRLPFVSSSTLVQTCFDIVHSDLWTSPIPSLSGFKYYVLFLDHYSQYVWVYPCLCDPHLDTTHKLESRATPSIVLGHATNHSGYHCLNLNRNKIIISRHVTFDETIFPFGSMTPTSSPSYAFLEEPNNIISHIIRSTPTNTTSLQMATNTPPHKSAQTTNTPPAQPPVIVTQQHQPAHVGPTSPTVQTAQPESPMHAISPTHLFDSPAQPVSPLIVNPNPSSVHLMVTRFHVGRNRPPERLNLHVSSISPLPKSPAEANIVHCMWLFRHKYLADGTLIHYKARLVANGSTKLSGVDVDETFNVKNAFLLGDLSETMYMHQPPGFQDSAHPDYVCLLQRSLYDLKQASRAWFQRFAAYITRVGFTHSRCDSSLFIYTQGHEFSMSDLGSLNYFMGISVTRDSSGMFLSQSKYATQILERTHMAGCNSSWTPVDTEFKLGDDGDLVSGQMLYRSVAGYLQYLTFTRPDIFYAVQQVCLYMHDPREPRFSAFKRILRNLLRELHTPLSSATLVYCDTANAVYLSYNPVQHQRTKHLIDIHFVQDLVAAGQIRVLHVPSRYQYADIFTKGLPFALFEEFRTSLSVRCPLTQTEGEC